MLQNEWRNVPIAVASKVREDRNATLHSAMPLSLVLTHTRFATQSSSDDQTQGLHQSHVATVSAKPGVGPLCAVFEPARSVIKLTGHSASLLKTLCRQTRHHTAHTRPTKRCVAPHHHLRVVLYKPKTVEKVHFSKSVN
jgi:hypothetical protein